MSFLNLIRLDRQLDVTLGSLITSDGVTTDVGDVDAVTEAKATAHLIAVDDDDFFQLTVYVVETPVLMLTEVIEPVVLLRRTNVEQALTVGKEVVPNRIEACIELVVLQNAIDKVFALVAEVVLAGEKLDTLTDTEKFHLRQVRRDDAGINDGAAILINVCIDNLLKSGLNVGCH